MFTSSSSSDIEVRKSPEKRPVFRTKTSNEHLDMTIAREVLDEADPKKPSFQNEFFRKNVKPEDKFA